METFDAQPDRPVHRKIDPERRFAQIPRDYSIKGMFCQSLVDLLEEDWPKVRRDLLAPPPEGGRYRPFGDYPQYDYCLVALAAARRLFPDEPLSEAARKLGRQDMLVFATSPMGRTLFERGAALADIFDRLPDLYRMVVRGGTIETEWQGDRSAKVIFDDYHGWVDCYTIGTIEGIVQHYDCRPLIRVTLFSSVDAEYLVSWE